MCPSPRRTATSLWAWQMVNSSSWVWANQLRCDQGRFPESSGVQANVWIRYHPEKRSTTLKVNTNDRTKGWKINIAWLPVRCNWSFHFSLFHLIVTWIRLCSKLVWTQSCAKKCIPLCPTLDKNAIYLHPSKIAFGCAWRGLLFCFLKNGSKYQWAFF